MKDYSVARAAEELGVTTGRIRAMIFKKRLKAYRDGPRNLFITPKDLEAVRDRKPGRPTVAKKAVAKKKVGRPRKTAIAAAELTA